jgi:hypothetical protein
VADSSARLLIWIQRVKKVSGPLPISTFIKHKHSASFLFVSILSPVLNALCQEAHPFLEDALDAIESEVIPDPCIGSSISSLELKV